MVQVPGERRSTVLPLRPLVAQTLTVVEVNVTGSPEDAVADTVNGVSSIVRFARAPNVIDWPTRLTAKLRDTDGAGLNAASPA